MEKLGFLGIQLLGLVPSLICITSLQSGNRKRILALQTLCCVMWGVHYGLLGAYTAVMTDVIGIVRAVICYYNDRAWAKGSAWPYIFLAAYAGAAALTWDGLYCALPCLSMALTTFALWTHDMRKTRFLFLVNSPPLIVYNALTRSYSCLAIEIFAFMSFILAIVRFDILKKE